MDEVSLLPQLRHPNIVQFLGAVTQQKPFMLITEYLPRVRLPARVFIFVLRPVLAACSGQKNSLLSEVCNG